MCTSMSRYEFINFIKTIEHNIIIKEKIIECKTAGEFILLAKKYGYSITLEDLNYDRTATLFGSWFKKSRIHPLKYIK